MTNVAAGSTTPTSLPNLVSRNAERFDSDENTDGQPMNRNSHSKKETGVQTDRLPTQWKVMNRVRVQVQEQLIVVQERTPAEQDDETLEERPELEVLQRKENERSNTI